MKKLSIIIGCMLMVLTSTMITSCGDNTDFWGAHVLTDDEIAEMKRQDSIKEAQRNTIHSKNVIGDDMCPAHHIKIVWFCSPHTLKVLNILYVPQ